MKVSLCFEEAEQRFGQEWCILTLISLLQNMTSVQQISTAVTMSALTPWAVLNVNVRLGMSSTQMARNAKVSGINWSE